VQYQSLGQSYRGEVNPLGIKKGEKMLELYDYQRETVDNVMGETMFGAENILVSSCISSGKTLQIVTIAMEMSGTVLISLSISDLVDQFVETFIEQGFDDFTVLKAGHDISFDNTKRVIIGMDNTCFSRLHLLPRGITALMSDEIHIRYQGDRYKAIKDHLDPEHHIGFTGTPYSSRGTMLERFDTQFTSININTLIEEGKLATPKYLVPRWTLDPAYNISNKIGAEYTSDDLECQQSELFITKVVDNYFNNEHFNGMNSKSIWFCSSVEMAKRYEKEIQSRGYMAVAYHGKLKKDLSKSIMFSFKNNEKVLFDKDIHLFNFTEAHEPIRVMGLISVNKLAVGFSVSDVDVGVRTSSTSILSRHYQIDGRSIRSFRPLDKVINKLKDSIK